MATISKSVAEFKAVRTTLTEADSVTVSDTSAKIKASLGALLNDVKVDQIVSTDGKEIKVAINQLGFDLSKLVKFTAADNVTVTGSSADISKSIGTFFSSEAVKHIDSTQQSYVKINVAQEQVAANMAKLLAADKISIVDTTANIQSKLSALLADAKIDLIDSSETSAINLKVADLTTANLAKLMLNDTIAVSDTTANIQANLASLLSNSKVDSINSVASTTITLSAEQLTQSNINKLSADDTIKVVLTSEDKVLTADQITLLKDAKIDSYSNAYTVSSKVADATSSLVDEGGQITFTISAIAPVEKDTTFTYQIQGDTSNAASASDVTPAFGKVTILAGQLSKSISVNAVSDGLVEFNEGAIFKLLDSTGSKQIASAPFSIQDGASYSFSAPVVSANEGSTVEFSLNTTNVADGTEISYVLSGVNVTASDFVNNSLTGTATVSGGVATISVPLANDLKTEGAETLKVTAQGKSSTVTINDTSLDANYTITANQAKADEGTDATFSIATNAADGSTVSYTLSGAGITATDVGASSLEGAVTVNGGVATITLPLSKDASTEGDEVLTLSVGGKTASTTITDKSFTPLLSPDAVVGTIDKLSGQGIAIMDASVVTGFKTNDIDSTGAVPAGTVIVDDTSETNGQLLVLANGKTAFVADDGQRKGTFEYSVAGIDGKGTVNVTINASPVYDTTSNSAAITTAEDALPITSTIKFTDADGDKLTYTFGQAAHGTVTQVADGSYTYTPNANYNGTDTFKVQVTDGYALTSTSQDVAVTVTSVNDAPQALTPAPAAIAVKSGQTGITVDLANYATDPDLAAGTITGLTFALSTATTKNGGVATLGADGHTVTINYPQNGGAAALGDDSIGFTVNDGTAAPVTATVTLNVANTEPVAADFALNAKTGVLQIIDLTANTSTQGIIVTPIVSGVSDADKNSLTPLIALNSLTKGGSAEVVNGKIQYTSTVGFVGDEILSYTVSDGFGGVSKSHTITFHVQSNTGGTSGDDLLYGSLAAESIDGLAGKDTIVGGGGLDTITGGNGDDVVTFNDGAVQILGGNDVDKLIVGSDALASTFDLSRTDNQMQDGTSINSLGKSATVRGFENIDASNASNAITIDAVLPETTTLITSVGKDIISSLAAVTGTINVTLNAGNDTVTTISTLAASATVNIDAGLGNDTITSGATASTLSIIGGDGDDTINASSATGANTLDGGAGNDTISLGSGTTVVTVGDGNDTINTNAANSSSNLAGGAGNDTFAFASANLTETDTISGGEGTDTLTVTDAATVVDLDFTNVTGLEVLSVAAAASSVTLGALAKTAGVATITGSAGNDTITAGAAFTNALTVNVNTGVDNVDASATAGALTIAAAAASITTADSLKGGTGTGDVLLITADNNGTGAVFGATVNGFETLTVVASTTATDDLVITTDNGMVAATKSLTVNAAALTNSGATLTFNGAAEADGSYVITGGAGNDTVTGGAAADTINGGLGNDTIDTGNGNNVVDAGDGNDTITAGNGNDKLTGGAGDDRFVLAGNMLASDTIDGGTGTNVLQVSTSVANAAALAGVSNVTTLEVDGSSSVTLAANVLVTTFDFSDATDQDLILNTGYTAATKVVLTGDNAGNDDSVINLANAALTVVGNVSDFDATTTITGGTGTDVVQMTADSGTATISAFSKVDTITVGAGTVGTETATVTLGAVDTVIAAGATLVVNASALTNTTATFTFTGNAAETDGFLSITGGAGNDTITGGNAADTINGGLGNDTIDTLNGNNVVDAGDGDDSITAGTGADKLTGGIGNDRFVLAGNMTAADTIDGGTGTNVLQVSSVVASAAVLAGVTNVATLEVDGATAVTLAANVVPTTFDFIDAGDQVLTLNTGYTAATTVVLTGDLTANADTVVNAANVALTVVGNVADFDATTVITGGTGADVVQMKADAGTATISAFTNVDTITIGAGTTGAEAATLVLGAVDSVIANGKTLAVNASALTNAAAAFTFTGNAAETDGKLSITGGAGNDTITGSNGADTILGGSGVDVISGLAGLDVLTGGAGNDIFTIGASANGNIFATITDATAGDIISFTNWGTETFAATKLALGSTAVFQDYLNFAAAGDGSTNAAISWFQFSGNTYVVEDLSAGASFVNGTDLVVSLTGLVELSTATGAGTNALTLV